MLFGAILYTALHHSCCVVLQGKLERDEGRGEGVGEKREGERGGRRERWGGVGGQAGREVNKRKVGGRRQ